MDRLWQVSINSYWPLSATWPFELPADATCTPPLSPTKWPPSATWTPLSPPKRPLSACCFQHGPPNRPPSACYHWRYSRRHIRETSTRDQVRFSICILDLISPHRLSMYKANSQYGVGREGWRGNIEWSHSGQRRQRDQEDQKGTERSETSGRSGRSDRSERPALEIRPDSP